MNCFSGLAIFLFKVDDLLLDGKLGIGMLVKWSEVIPIILVNPDVFSPAHFSDFKLIHGALLQVGLVVSEVGSEF